MKRSLLVGLLIGLGLGPGCKEKAAELKKPSTNPHQIERQVLCDEYKAAQIAMGAEPRNTFMNNCMTSPTDLVRCLLPRHYETHVAECDAVIKANPGVSLEIR